MHIREYQQNDVIRLKELLEELQRHIVQLDPAGLNIVGDGFRDVYAGGMLRKIHEGNGKVYVAEDEAGIVGFIAGVLESYDEADGVTYKCPAEGRIIELVVTEKFRGGGAGAKLMAAMEGYFRGHGCENVRVEVFAHNEAGAGFYNARVTAPEPWT